MEQTVNFETKYPMVLGSNFKKVKILATSPAIKLITAQGIDIATMHSDIVARADSSDPIKTMKLTELKWYLMETEDGKLIAVADEYLVPGSLIPSSEAVYKFKVLNIKSTVEIGTIKKALNDLGFKIEEVE